MTLKRIPPEINNKSPQTLLLVGRDPGEQEEAVGRPFVGPAGQLLERCLGQVGLRREDVNLANLVGCRPADNIFRRHSEGDVERGLGELQSLIQRLRPNIIVALGNEASYSLVAEWPSSDGIFGATGITERRGYIWEGEGNVLGGRQRIKVLTTLHPAACLINRDPSGINEMLLVNDLEKARDEAKSAKLDRPRRRVDVISSKSAVPRLQGTISCDIENPTPHRDSLQCIGFATSPEQAYVFTPPAFDAAFEILEDPSIHKVFHNGFYDIYYLLSRWNIRTAGYTDDTMIAWHCIAGNQEIDTLAGKIPINQLEHKQNIWVWGYSGGNFTPVKVSSIFRTKVNASLIKVRLLEMGKPGVKRKSPSDQVQYNVKEVICTPEHLFLTQHGWVQAQDLITGDGLIHVKIQWSDRPVINVRGQQIAVSRYVWECLHGFIPEGMQIHHIDGNPTNNMPDNLMCISLYEHSVVHDKLKHLDQTGTAPKHKHVWSGEKVDPDEVIKLYKAGLSVDEVARHFNTHYRTVYNLLDEYRVPRRSLSEAQQLRRSKERNARVLEVEELDYKEDVYCMVVPKTSNFTIHGCVVHNCLWPEIAGFKVDEKGKRRKIAKRTQKSLSFLASIYTKDEWWKDYDFDSDAECYQLNGKDCCITLDIWQQMQQELRERDLRSIYEHEMSLVWPCIEIQSRGFVVDDGLRKQRLSQLTLREQELREKLVEVATPLIQERRDRLEHEHLFFKVKRCKCCGNGKKKRMMCWSCAGFEHAPSKAELKNILIERGWESYIRTTNKEDLEPLALPTCQRCAASGITETFHFNPNSEKQMKDLLYNVLKLPKRFKDGRLSTNEESLKSILGAIQ